MNRLTEVEEVLTRDRSTGRIHLRLRSAGRLFTQEGCNLDQAGGYDVVGPEALENAEAGDLCENDWPEGASSTRLERYVG